MYLELTDKQFRRLLDLCYIGNWVLNSIRGEDRFEDYDRLESLLFAAARQAGMGSLTELSDGVAVPSRAYVEGGIHEAIMEYEDTVFFEILAEELARRDLAVEGHSDGDAERLSERIREYITEFETNGTDNLTVNSIDN